MSVRLLGLAFITVIFMQLTGCATQDKKIVASNQSHFLKSKPDNQFYQHRDLREVINEALSMQGRPYVPGGDSPRTGFDCSGLVFYVFNRQGIKLPRDTSSLAKELPSVPSHQKQPGDLVFFGTSRNRPFSHVGIYLGEDKFIHAASSRTGQVTVSSMRLPYWQERFSGVRRPQSDNG